jgi:hypothetical protein
MLVLSSAEATLDRPTAADVSMTGPVRVEEATVLGGRRPSGAPRAHQARFCRVWSGTA